MSQQFEATPDVIDVFGVVRPVLKLGKRLFVGETLSMLNPYGYGGRVWASTKGLDQLKFNVHEGRHDGTGN